MAVLSASLTTFSDVDLPPAFETNESNDFVLDAEPVELPPDQTVILNVPSGICPTCGEAVIREPGTRGRLPKYHPECKPARSSKSGGSISGQPRTIRVSKAELVAAEETQRILDFLYTKLTQAAMLLALVEPYDALVIRINTPELLNNLRPVLMRFDKLRAFAVGTETGGSLFGLIMAVCTTLLPIAAHHNMVPVKRISQFLLQLPMTMLAIQKRMAEGNEENLTDELFAKAQEQANRVREAYRRRATEESANGPTVEPSNA